MQKQGTGFLNALGKHLLQQSVFYGLLYFLKGMIKIEKDKKLYEYMERGKGYLCD